MGKRYTFSIGRKQMPLDKYLTLPSSPFCWKKSSILIMALSALKYRHWLPLRLFLAQAPASAGVPFPITIAYQSPSLFTSSEKFSQILPGLFLPSPFPHWCCLDAFAAFPPGPFLFSRSWRAGSFPYLYPHPSARALVAWHLVNVTAFSCPDDLGSQQRLMEGWWAEVTFSLRDVKRPRNLAWHPHWPPFQKPLQVCSLPLESSSSGPLLTSL